MGRNLKFLGQYSLRLFYTITNYLSSLFKYFMDKQQAWQRVAGICSGQEKCIFEIKQKLITWDVDIDVVNDIIDQLCTEKYIDEKRYATAFTNDKFRFNVWGKKKIAHAMAEKKIPADFIEQALDLIPHVEYIDCLKALLIKKKSLLKEADVYKLKIKLIRFAVSRGFEAQVAFDVLGEIIEIND